jgi:hypothetical protein
MIGMTPYCPHGGCSIYECATCQDEHDPPPRRRDPDRCCFCGYHPGFVHRHRPIAWQDVAGRPVCDDECAEKETARQAAQGDALVHSEVDGLWGLSLGQRHVGPCAILDELLDKIAMEEMS